MSVFSWMPFTIGYFDLFGIYFATLTLKPGYLDMVLSQLADEQMQL